MEGSPWWSREHDSRPPAAAPPREQDSREHDSRPRAAAPPHAAARTAKGTGRVAGKVVRRVRSAAHADGADRSGLAALLWMHALHVAGDSLVTVSLAGTLFFDTSSLGQARGRVALYLVLTLLPFAFLVPVAGPLLDRFRHGRRNVFAVTCGARGLVAWSMAGFTTSLGLYPLALAVLVLSRAYGLARSAALPRVRPPSVSLVAANARVNVAAVVSATIAASVGGAVSYLFGVGWTLRLAGLVLLVAAVAAVRLPAHVDEDRTDAIAAPAYKLRTAPLIVRRPLVAALALRALGGMLTIFLAFLLRAENASTATIGVVLGGAVVGQVLGTVAASRLSEQVVRRLTLAALVVPATVCLLAALNPGTGLAALAAGLAGLGGALSKFRLDAVLQSQVPGPQTSGAFARSETALQLAWAIGGSAALAVPTQATAGFAVATLFPLAGLVFGARAGTTRPRG